MMDLLKWLRGLDKMWEVPDNPPWRGDKFHRGSKTGKSIRSKHGYPRPVQPIETKRYGRVY